jgi:hypothetical protein
MICYASNRLMQASEIDRALCVTTGARFLDYWDAPRFTDDDFYDCDHLNRVGEIEFTRILDQALSSEPYEVTQL